MLVPLQLRLIWGCCFLFLLIRDRKTPYVAAGMSGDLLVVVSVSFDLRCHGFFYCFSHLKAARLISNQRETCEREKEC
ncbi:hypothetical protein HD806DRAFT_513788 [Xylariaceae sp. AK1471]|nr:hypothetical protein HD806DRAFT_513788 [Xylariaceae sp. AK1471]